MGGVPRSNDLGSRLDRLERAVSNLQRQSTLSSASISEGNLTVRRGGSIRVIDDGSIIGEGTGVLDWEGPASFGGDTEISGDLTVSGDTDIVGGLDVSGTTRIGGNLTIDGNTRLEGNLTFGDDSIPPAALSRRTEARTFSGTGTGNGTTRTQNVTVNVPSWAQTTSCYAFGISSVAVAPARALSRITIAGDQGPEVEASSDLALAVPAAHARDFSPAGGSSFTVSLYGGLQGTTPSPWTQILIVQCVFTKSN